MLYRDSLSFFVTQRLLRPFVLWTRVIEILVTQRFTEFLFGLFFLRFTEIYSLFNFLCVSLFFSVSLSEIFFVTQRLLRPFVLWTRVTEIFSRDSRSFKLSLCIFFFIFSVCLCVTKKFHRVYIRNLFIPCLSILVLKLISNPVE